MKKILLISCLLCLSACSDSDLYAANNMSKKCLDEYNEWQNEKGNGFMKKTFEGLYIACLCTEGNKSACSKNDTDIEEIYRHTPRYVTPYGQQRGGVDRYPNGERTNVPYYPGTEPAR